ncbi:MAG: molybdopterin-dependent oxidoreductase [Vampirovibrionales bacterium]|nr:molybdopterin-dependent oxidoreductase [Vampirovibrionales bacterium]
MSAFYALRHVASEDAVSDRASAPEFLHSWPATFAATSGQNPSLLKSPSEGLQIGGLVKTERQWSLQDILKLPRVNQIRRIVSADGWSTKGHWEGVSLKHLLDLVEPLPTARFLKQENSQGHVEYLPLQAVLSGDYLLAHHESEHALSALYGGPLWLLVFDRYSYKGLGHLTRLTLCEAPDEPSTSTLRGYSENGFWEPATKVYAIDLKTFKTLDRSNQEIKLF